MSKSDQRSVLLTTGRILGKLKSLLVAQTVDRKPRFNPWVGIAIPLEKGMATLSSILAWQIPWTGEPGGLQSMGSHRVR